MANQRKGKDLFGKEESFLVYFDLFVVSLMALLIGSFTSPWAQFEDRNVYRKFIT